MPQPNDELSDRAWGANRLLVLANLKENKAATENLSVRTERLFKDQNTKLDLIEVILETKLDKISNDLMNVKLKVAALGALAALVVSILYKGVEWLLSHAKP